MQTSVYGEQKGLRYAFLCRTSPFQDLGRTKRRTAVRYQTAERCELHSSLHLMLSTCLSICSSDDPSVFLSFSLSLSLTLSVSLYLFLSLFLFLSPPIFFLSQARDHCKAQILSMRFDHTRPHNPTPYKISVSQKLYEFIHQLWMAEAPIADLS